MKRTILFIVGFLLLTSIVCAGVTNPLPTELNLLPGESGRFRFQIQTVASNEAVDCIVSLSGDSILEVEFDPAEISVAAGTVKDVLGTVIVPEEIELGTYEETFCVACNTNFENSGTSVKKEYCDLPIIVNVVEDREKENMYISPKPGTNMTLIIIYVGIILIALIIFYFWKLSKNSKSKKKVPKKRVVRKKKK